MRCSWLATLAMVVLFMMSACSSSPGADSETLDDTPGETADEVTIDDGSEPVLIEASDLDGTSWTLLFGGSAEGEIEAIDGWPITLNFNGLNLSGTAACNGYGGSYNLSASSIEITELGSQDAGCDPAVQEAERLYQLALFDIENVDLIGDELALSGLSSELIFRRNDEPQVDELTATMWLLEASLQGTEATPVAGEPATLVVEPGGLLTASTGCRSLRGTYVVSGNEINLNTFSADGACPTSLRAQDSTVVSVLGDGFVPEVNGDQLILTSQGNEGLRYRATTEDEVESLPGSTAPTDAELLHGVDWVFTGGRDADGPIVDPRSLGDQQITFMVTNGEFSGTVHCNAYGGQVEMATGQWSLTQPKVTEEGCGTELDAIAERYLAALPLMSEFGIEGAGSRLTTNGSDIELSFERLG